MIVFKCDIRSDEDEWGPRGIGRNFAKTPPNNTVMIRGLAQHITATDIRNDIDASVGIVAQDVRLIRKKETGEETSS